MIRGDGRLDGGEDKDLALGADLKNRATAVADVHVALVVEGDACGHTHAFHPYRDVAVGSGLINNAVETAGDVQHAVPIKGHAARVHHVVDERLDGIVQIDYVNSDRYFLAT